MTPDDKARCRAAQALLADDFTQVVSTHDRGLVLRRWVEPTAYSKFATLLVGKKPARVPCDTSFFGGLPPPVEPDGEQLTIAWMERIRRRQQGE